MRWIRRKSLRTLLALSTLTGLAFGAEGVHSAPPTPEESALDVDECIDSHLQGQKYERSGQLLAALSEWNTCQHDSCSPLIRKDCESLAQALVPKIPTIQVIGLDGGEAVEGLMLEADDRPPTDLASGELLRIDPGTHQLVFKTPSGNVATKTITVEEGEHGSVVSVRLDEAGDRKKGEPTFDDSQSSYDKTSTSATTDSGSSKTSVPRDALERGPVPEQARSGDPWARSVTIGGGALVATGLALAIHSFARTESMERTCSPLCDEKTVARLRSQALAGDVMMAVGAIGVAYGIFRWSLSPDESKDYAIHLSPTSVAASGSF